MRKKVLITGADSFLGQEVIKLLKKKKIILFKTSRRKKKGYFNINLEDSNNLHKTLDKIKPNFIVNLGFIDIKRRNSKKKNIESINIIGNWCKKHNSRLIQASTVSVLLNKKNLYFQTKYLLEGLIRKINCKNTIVRFAGIYGYGNQNKRLGFNNSIMDAVNGKTPKFIGSKKSKRNYIYVSDAAKVIYKCIVKKINGTIFASGHAILSFEEMLNCVTIFFLNKKAIFRNKGSRKDRIYKPSKEIPKTNKMRDVLKHLAC